MENVKYIPGDLVKLDEEVCTIETIDRSKNHFDLLDEDGFWHVAWINEITPIPLTPQILEASGWKKNEYGVYYKNFNPHKAVCLTKEDGSNWCVSVGATTFIHCKFVHQLQHLLFGLGLPSELKV